MVEVVEDTLMERALSILADADRKTPDQAGHHPPQRLS